MEKVRIDRINELARKSKTEPLNDDELEEQRLLRAEYLAEVRRSFTATVGNTVIIRPDGSIERPTRKK